MSLVEEFSLFLRIYACAPSTRRVYLCAVRKALGIVGKTPEDCGSYEELRALLRENLAQKRVPRGLRIAPFMGFLDLNIPTTEPETPEYGPLRDWVIDRIEEQTKTQRNAKIFVRRNLAMMACLCVAPEKGSPRRWPKKALAVTKQGGEFTVKLWEKPVETPGLTLALLYWHTWRERLDRPDQGRLHRKAWAYSDLLFPGSDGKPLSRCTVNNALRQLYTDGENGVALTPTLIREAFLNHSRS